MTYEMIWADWCTNEFYDEIHRSLHSQYIYYTRLKKAEIYSKVLATESYVCAGIGFTKYLN